MSASAGSGSGLVPASAPVQRKVRAFVAPVTRASLPAASALVTFSPTAVAAGRPLTMPTGWIDLGLCREFVRRSASTVEAVRAGAPAAAVGQVRTAAGAEVEVAFEQWGKLQLALAAGVQQMNLLAASAAGTGTLTAALAAGSTATVLQVGVTAAAEFAVGDIVAVDADFAAQTGFIGAGAAGTYVSAGGSIPADVDYVRRVTLNVGVVAAIAGGALTLASSLLAGAPAAGMQVSKVAGFEDREGGGFFQEWSAVFCVEGEQGDRLFFYYPRLQAMAGAAEKGEALSGGLSRLLLQAHLRAIAVADPTDGAQVVCYRSYVPAPLRLV